MNKKDKIWTIFLSFSIAILLFSNQYIFALPISLNSGASGFIENKGQWDDEVRYLFKTKNYNAWLTDFGIVYEYFNSPSIKENNIFATRNDVIVMRYEKLDDKFSEDKDKNKKKYTTNFPLITKYNYFIGNDQSKWISDVSLYREVIVKNVFPNIDIRFYIDTLNNNNLRYDFEVSPLGDPNNISIAFECADSLIINPFGDLGISIGNNIYKHTNLYAYQQISENSKQIDCKFISNSDEFSQNKIGFYVGEYDHTQPLIIDPLIYSILIGSVEEEIAYSIALDTADCAFITGVVRSPQYPTKSAYNNNHNYGYSNSGSYEQDCFVTKFDKLGKNIIFSTFLGGSKSDVGRHIKVDKNWGVYIVGETNSSDSTLPHISFPRKCPNNPYLEKIKIGYNIFVTKLGPNGNTLDFSILLGGNDDDYAGGLELILDSLRNVKNIVVAGQVKQSPSFPPTEPPYTSPAAYRSSILGINDGYIAILNASGDTIRYATLFGGNGTEKPVGIAVDNEQNIYVTGQTTSYDTASHHIGSVTDTSNIFVAKFNSTLSNIIYYTYIGGSGEDNIKGIDIDEQGCTYIAGYTYSTNFPLTAGTITPLTGDSANIFIAKLNPLGTGLIYSTAISSNQSNYATDIVVDKSKNAHISGYTTSSNYPITWDAFFTDFSSYGDAIYTVIDTTGSSIVFSSLIGGEQQEFAHSLALDSNSAAYICGYTTSQILFPHSAIFADSVLILDSITIVQNPIAGYDTIPHYSLHPNLGAQDVFVYKASYKPYPGELATDLSDSIFCNGSSVRISIATPYGFYYPDNVFRVQLSDINGNFVQNSTVIGSLASNIGGNVDITFPTNLPASKKYRIRVVSSHPVSIGASNGFDLDIGSPYIDLDTNEIVSSICSGGILQVPFHINPCFTTSNILYLELSDTNGSFAQAIRLDSLKTNKSDTLVGIIDDTIPPSNKYKIRVVSTTPAINSNLLNFEIKRPNIEITNVDYQGLCSGQDFDFKFYATSCFEVNNIFYLVVSDTTGSFAGQVDTIGIFNGNGNDSIIIINSTIPINLPFSKNYKLKVISTNPAMEKIVGLDDNQTSFVLGSAYIFTDSLKNLSVCRNIPQTINLSINDCFLLDNEFNVYINSDSNWVIVGHSDSNRQNIIITIPTNSLIDSNSYLIIQTTKPAIISDSIPIIVKQPEIAITLHNPVELCESDDFSIDYSTNGCIVDTLIAYVELSIGNSNFSSPIVISDTIHIFNENIGTIICHLPDSINEDLSFYIRIKTNGDPTYSQPFLLNINPPKADFKTDMNDLKILCSGISFNIDFDVEGCFDLENIFSVILSDVNGQFDTPGSQVIGTLRTNHSGSIAVFIPLDIEEGINYRLKITSTLPITETILDLKITIRHPFIIIDSIANIVQCNPHPTPHSQFMGQQESILEFDIDSAYVSFIASDCFGDSNIFILQMAIDGDFENRAINIDTCGANARSFHFLLPEYMGLDTYRLRVISTNPSVASDDNGFGITYNQPYAAISVNSDLIVCRDTPVRLFYQTSDCFDSNNVFYLELSDISGNFYYPIILDSSTAKPNGEFNFVVPETIPFGITYKLRIRSTSPIDYFVQNFLFIISGPEILTGNLKRIILQRNDTLFVPFNTNCFNPDGKVFIVQLSDSHGNWENILEIGSQMGWAHNGYIYTRISLKATDGKLYRVRVVCKNPEVTGNDNGKDIIIFGTLTEINEEEIRITDITEPEVFPIPIAHNLNIIIPPSYLNNSTNIIISDLLGVERKSISNVATNEINIDMSNLQSGIYLITITSNTNRFNKVIIKK